MAGEILNTKSENPALATGHSSSRETSCSTVPHLVQHPLMYHPDEPLQLLPICKAGTICRVPVEINTPITTNSWGVLYTPMHDTLITTNSLGVLYTPMHDTLITTNSLGVLYTPMHDTLITTNSWEGAVLYMQAVEHSYVNKQ